MKAWSLCFFSFLALASVAASEERTFRSIHQTSSFEGEAVAFDPVANTVTIRREGGREVKYQLSFLSKEDQSYVQEHREALILAASIQVTTKEFVGEAKSGDSKNKGFAKPVGFTVSIKNSSDELREKMSAEYTLYFRKGLKAGMGPVSKKSGTMALGQLQPEKTATAQTTTVDLAREVDLGDDCCSRRVMPGGGWPDVLLGCKIVIKVDGKVV